MQQYTEGFNVFEVLELKKKISEGTDFCCHLFS